MDSQLRDSKLFTSLTLSLWLTCQDYVTPVGVASHMVGVKGHMIGVKVSCCCVRCSKETIVRSKVKKCEFNRRDN